MADYKHASQVIFECDNATIDISHYPIIVQRLKPIDHSIAQTEAYLSVLNAVVENTSGPFVIVTDTSNAVYLNAKSRIKIAKGINELERKHLDRSPCP